MATVLTAVSATSAKSLSKTDNDAATPTPKSPTPKTPKTDKSSTNSDDATKSPSEKNDERVVASSDNLTGCESNVVMAAKRSRVPDAASLSVLKRRKLDSPRPPPLPPLPPTAPADGEEGDESGQEDEDAAEEEVAEDDDAEDDAPEAAESRGAPESRGVPESLVAPETRVAPASRVVPPPKRAGSERKGPVASTGVVVTAGATAAGVGVGAEPRWEATALQPGDYVLFAWLRTMRLYEGEITQINQHGVALVEVTLRWSSTKEAGGSTQAEPRKRFFKLDIVNGTTHRVFRVFRPDQPEGGRQGSFHEFPQGQTLWLEPGDVFGIFLQGGTVEFDRNGDLKNLPRTVATVHAVLRYNAEISYPVDPAKVDSSTIPSSQRPNPNKPEIRSAPAGPPPKPEIRSAPAGPPPLGKTKSGKGTATSIVVRDWVLRNTLRFDQIIHHEPLVPNPARHRWVRTKSTTLANPPIISNR